MINGISSNSRYISVQGGNPSKPYISPGSAGAGMVRWNINMNALEINDGNTWLSMSATHATIELTPETESLLDWARKKRDEENALYELASKNEAVRIALDQLEQARTRLELTAILAREHDTTS